MKMMEKEFGIDLPDAYLFTSVGTWFIMYVLDKINSNVVGFDYRGGAESEMIARAKKKIIKYFLRVWIRFLNYTNLPQIFL